MKRTEQGKLDRAARMLLAMKAPSKQKAPIPTKADLNRKFRISEKDGNAKFEEVLD